MPEGAQKLRGDWSLVYVGDGGCDEDCRTALVFARQTRLSLGKEMTRLSRVMLVTDNCCDVTYLKKEHDGIKVFDVSGDRRTRPSCWPCCRWWTCSTRCSWWTRWATW